MKKEITLTGYNPKFINYTDTSKDYHEYDSSADNDNLAAYMKYNVIIVDENVDDQPTEIDNPDLDIPN